MTNKVRFIGTAPSLQVEKDPEVEKAIEYLTEHGLTAFVGDGTDTIHLTKDGLEALSVMLVLLETARQGVHPKNPLAALCSLEDIERVIAFTTSENIRA